MASHSPNKKNKLYSTLGNLSCLQKSTKDGETKTWQKTTNPTFDVTMGAPDGAEICELVGLYILDTLRQKVPEMKFGLYRDDGLRTP